MQHASEYDYGSTVYGTVDGMQHQYESSLSFSWWLASDRLAHPPLPPPEGWKRVKTSFFASVREKLSLSKAIPSLRGVCCSSKRKCGSSVSSVSCRAIYRGYFFRSKAVVLLLVINALFSTALYGVTSEVLKIIIGAEFALTRNLVMHGVTQILFPIAGHIADVYAGKHNMLRFSLWVAWFGFAILAMAFSLDTFENNISSVNRYAILPFAFGLLSISYVCFVSTILPFGMDQLQGASHIHYRSFFYWWYWTLNIGVIIVNVPQYCRARTELSVMLQAGIGVACISLSLILDALLKHWFTIEPKQSTNNPLSQILKVLRGAAATSKDIQKIPSVVRHELDLRQLSRLDLVKDRYGGSFETEQVEDVRTFFRILLVLVTIGFAVFSYSGVFGTVGLVAAHMRSSLISLVLHTNVCDVEFNLDDGINGLLLIIFIPLLDLLVVPLLQNSNPNILKRLGFGATLAFASLMSLFLIEAIGTHRSEKEACMFDQEESRNGQLEMNVYWILLPIVIVTLAEVFIYIPCFEFICAQSPYNMRGLLVGIFFSIQGSFSLLSVLLQYIFMWKKVYTYPFLTRTGLTCAFWYYFMLLVPSLLGLVTYFVVAYRYKRRQRDYVFNDVTMIEEYFTLRTGAMNSRNWMNNNI